MFGTSDLLHSTSNYFYYLTIQDCTHGFMLGYANNFLFDHLLLKDNSNYGMSIGGLGDYNCDGGTVQNSESDHNGTSESDTGFQVVGSTNITIKNTISHDCPRRNFDYGTVGDAIKINSETYSLFVWPVRGGISSRDALPTCHNPRE